MSIEVPTAADRGQSNVIGVAVLIGLTMISLGTLTAAVGTVVESNAAAANADRVADDLEAAIQPVEATGRHTGRVSFTDGEFRTVDRTVRIHDGSGWTAYAADGVAYESGSHRVLAVAGAVVRDYGGGAKMYRDPPFAVSEGVALFGIAVLDGEHTRSVTADDATTLALTSNVSHERAALGDGEFAVAIETDAPGAWERYFERIGADVERKSFAGDAHDSVVARFDGTRTGYLVRHTLGLEVRHV
ncbi:DUF7289 family protein [Haloparvum sp. PAK95]|uniref:DUF7289 family protein n=1 Tax=Haloparvum sp. PAK95 TaxID=3418962 RepID=UPI003D2EF540